MKKHRALLSAAFLAYCAGSACTAQIDGRASRDETSSSGIPSGGVGGGRNPAGGSGGAAPKGGLAPMPEPTSQNCAVNTAVAPLWRLTRVEYLNTIRDLLGVRELPDFDLPDGTEAGFSAATPMSTQVLQRLADTAETLAATVAQSPGSLVPCDVARGGVTCAGDFIARFGERAFRRPLLVEERQELEALFRQAETQFDFRTGVEAVVIAVLQSPFFLYRAEGLAGAAAVVPLDGYEQASRLSYALWDTMPDDDLFAAARAGRLHDPADVRAQALRMLMDDRAKPIIASFHAHWLGLLEEPDKDTDVFPAYTPELARAMRDETAEFVSHVVRQGDGKLATLLTADFTVTRDPRLQALYGVRTSSGDRVQLPAGQRAGLFTQASVMARWATTTETSPIHRGVFVREHIMCQHLVPPPPGIVLMPPPVDGKATGRQRYQQHSADPTCAGCHRLIDEVGFLFEAYDGIGQYRTREFGQAIDTTGKLVGAGDLDGEYRNALELAAKLPGSPQVRDCVFDHWFRFVFARAPQPADSCTVARARKRFADSQGDIKELLLSLLDSDSFRFRQASNPGGSR